MNAQRGSNNSAFRRTGRLALAMSVLAVVIGICAGPAQAQVGLAALPNPTPADPTVPHPVTVGQTFDWDVTVRNTSDPSQVGSFVIPTGGILLTPSCGAANFFPPCTAPDLDVFSFSATATGMGGTASCAQSYTITIVNDPSGNKKLRFDGAPVTLSQNGQPGDSCTIRFQATAVRATTLDSNPSVPGSQTYTLAEASGQVPPGQPGAGLTASGTGSASITVQRSQPAIATNASPNVATLGVGALTDNAAISGLVNPQGGTVEFRLYVTPDCSGAAIYTSSNRAITLNGSTGVATAQPFTPTTAGTYRWRAFYSGDANNSPVSGACNDANENVVVTPATPAITTNASPTITLGNGTLTDTAVVSGRVNPQPNATVTFRLYGPGDVNCQAPPIYTSTVPYPVGAGAAVSQSFVPQQTGTYRWIATYSGDANNFPVSGICNAANENVVVTPATPAIATNASPNITLGNGTLTDTATITGLVNAQGGTVDFRLYVTPDCSGAPIYTSPSRAVTMNGSTGVATAQPFTPTTAGTYRWRAFYSGDANNSPVSGVCNAANENVVVTAATPSVTTGAASAITETTASLAGTITPNGASTAYVFEYGTSLSFGSITPPASAGSGAGAVSVSAGLSGLIPSTTYYYRLVASSSAGTTLGTVRSFSTTGTGQPPIAITGAASSITNTGATLAGQVNPRGSQTAFTFEYGTSTSFGQITPVIALDDADAFEPVSATLSGLASNTTYYYRTVASNANGTSSGAVGSFSTGPGGPPIATTGVATSITATSAMLSGTVNPNSSPTAYTFEYGTTNAFGSISAVDSAGSTSGANTYSLPVSGLSPNTTYLFRIVATNANGTTTGTVGSFATASAGV